jgi:hypothetical protein
MDKSISNITGSVVVIDSKVGGNVINNVNLDHLPGSEEDKKDLLTLISRIESLAKQLPDEREEDKQKIIKRLQGVVTELSTNPDKESLQFNLESLRKAAQNVAAVLPDILPIAIEISRRIGLMVP